MRQFNFLRINLFGEISFNPGTANNDDYSGDGLRIFDGMNVQPIYNGHPNENPTDEIPDIVFQDQEGNDVNSYRDLIKGSLMAIDFIFATGTTICPPWGATYSRLQPLMGDRPGGLVSVSVDPVTDTFPGLKAWKEQSGADPGWTLC